MTAVNESDLGMPSLRRDGLDSVPAVDPDAPPATRKDFTSDQEVRWCPGVRGLRGARRRPGLPARPGPQAREHHVRVRHRLLEPVPYYLDTFGMHSIHGRAPAIAPVLPPAVPTSVSGWLPATATR
jgi:2-oxoglutarate ferredoxin oxidoreductase subunit beta